MTRWTAWIRMPDAARWEVLLVEHGDGEAGERRCHTAVNERLAKSPRLRAAELLVLPGNATPAGDACSGRRLYQGVRRPRHEAAVAQLSRHNRAALRGGTGG